MTLKQISVFLENKQGTLAEATKVLGENGIDLIALSIADTADFGIMRCIVNQPDKALALLAEHGFAASTTEVLAVEVPDQPGGLASVLMLLDKNDLNVEYLYSFARTPQRKCVDYVPCRGYGKMCGVTERKQHPGIFAGGNFIILRDRCEGR